MAHSLEDIARRLHGAAGVLLCLSHDSCADAALSDAIALMADTVEDSARALDDIALNRDMAGD